MQGAQNIVGATRCGCPRLGAHMGAPLQFRNDEGEAQRRRWTFYEAIIFPSRHPLRSSPRLCPKIFLNRLSG